MTADHTEITKSTMKIGERLVELCQADKSIEAIDELYAEHCEHHECMESGDPNWPRITKGRDAIRKTTEAWYAMNEIHSSTTTGPYPNGNEFIVMMEVDLTPKAGPMEGKRFTMTEACHYIVEDGKIVRGTFFYPPFC